MALSLTCACGARFEVEDTLAGQTVSCPECEQPLKAPALERAARRTSLYALASTTLALTGAFTVVGTVAAVVLGVVALVSIARNRERLAGVGFAAFGILGGTAFTALTLLALSTSELFGIGGWVRERNMADQVDTEGPLEVVVPAKGVAVTRPSAKWGQAHGNEVDDPLVAPFQRELDLLLVQVSRYAFVDVRVDSRLLFHGLDQCRDAVLADFKPPARRQAPAWPPPDEEDDGGVFAVGDPKVVQEPRAVSAKGGVPGQEMVVDVRCGGQSWRFLIRLYKRERGPLYVVRGYTLKRRFGQAEAELRQALDSFRILPGR